MSWIDYHNLFVKYDGNLMRAKKSELASAARGNPNTPIAAMNLAAKKYQEEHPNKAVVKAL